MLVVRLVITTGRIFLFSAGSICPKITFPATYKNFRDVNNFFSKIFIYQIIIVLLQCQTKKHISLWQEKMSLVTVI